MLREILPPRQPVILPHVSGIHFVRHSLPGNRLTGPQFYARISRLNGSVALKEYRNESEWNKAKLHSDLIHSEKHSKQGKQIGCKCSYCK